jgi:hypothetical protein
VDVRLLALPAPLFLEGSNQLASLVQIAIQLALVANKHRAHKIGRPSVTHPPHSRSLCTRPTEASLVLRCCIAPIRLCNKSL